MDTFEFDSDAFYICTEIAPRNFVVQKAIQIDKSQIERMVGKLDGKTTVIVEKTSPSPESSAGTSSAHSPSSTSVSGVSGIPQPPSLPYWFNRECKTALMMVGPPPHGPNIPSSSTTFFNPPVPRLLTNDDIKLQLKNQLEYYFSRENLLTDRYLKCQMDQDHFVPINVVAGFPKVSRLTNDIELIVEAVKDSLNLELDENMEKVRAVSKRTTIIIREVPEEFRDEVVRLLDNGPQFTELTYGLNDSWYVTYDNELDTQVAYISVQRRKNELTQKPVCARIKAGGIPASIAPPPEVVSPEPVRLAATTNGEKGPSIQVLDPGQPLSLGEIGLIPVATYRPGEQMTHYVTPTCSFSVNSYGYAQPMQPQQQSQSMISSQSQQYFYPSSTSTTPRNFDEMSTASSNSTRTTSSNYNNRNGGNRNGGNGGYNNQYYESRNSFSSSNEWRPRGGGHRGGYQNNQQTNHRDSHRDSYQNSHQNSQQNSQQNAHQNTHQNSYQNSHQSNQHSNQQNSRTDSHQNSHQSNQQGNHQNHNEYSGRQNNGRGNWRNGGRSNGTTNGTTHQYSSRQNGHQNSWRNEQNGYSSSSTTNWQSNDTQSSTNSYNRSNSNYNNSYNKGYNNGYHSSHNHTYNNRYNSHPSSSSSSEVSSKHVSSEEIETPTNSVPSTPSPPVKKQEEFRVVTPTDLPTPPVWPAPSFDRRRKSSEASSTTITTSTTTNTLTPSTPVTPSDNFPVFPQEDTLNMVKELNINENSKDKKEVNGINHPKPAPKVEQKTVPAAEKEKVKSPPASTKVKTPPVVEATPSFAFEAEAFPSLPQKIEPVKPPQKPTFSSVAAGRPKQIKQMPPQKKISYAEKLQQRESLLRK